MGRMAENLVGQYFGELKVIRRAEDTKSRHPRWVCRCNCGRKCIVEGRNLKSGKTKSCGCMARGVKQNGSMNYDEMTTPSDSRSRLLHDESDPYQNLANAIVCVAADDYRNSLKKKNKKLKKELEEFFHSSWYKALTKLDGDTLLGLLRLDHRGELAAVSL